MFFEEVENIIFDQIIIIQLIIKTYLF